MCLVTVDAIISPIPQPCFFAFCICLKVTILTTNDSELEAEGFVISSIAISNTQSGNSGMVY